MVDSQGAHITPDDVNAFAQKLEEWSASLPEKERALLAVMLDSTQVRVAQLSDQEQTIPKVQFAAPLASIVGRVVLEPEAGAIFIKESGPTWVKSPHHLDEWAEVVRPEGPGSSPT